VKLVRPGDVVILVLAAALVGASYAFFWGPRDQGDMAVISVGHTLVKEVSLLEDESLTVKGLTGDSILQVKDGRIRFIDSPCPGRYCIHTGWIDRTGEVAACLPNGVVVEIRGGQREFDAINL
jgi:hypothetical protein